MTNQLHHHRMAPGLLVAAATAVISGVSVLVNSYGVHDVPNAAVYTTGKNLIATALLVGLTFALPQLRSRSLSRADAIAEPFAARAPASPAVVRPRSPLAGRSPSLPHLTLPQWLGLAYVAVIGGGLAFVLFFDGLARTAAVPSAFLHDTLVIWVALCCWPLLRERLSLPNLGAIALLVCGEVAISGGIGHLSANVGTLLVLTATWCWAAETIIAKRLLRAVAPGTLALVRMGGGSLALLGYLSATGGLAALGALNLYQLSWVLMTGCLLAGYVATWMIALSRARAVDVTSMLVASVAITALLQEGLGRITLGVVPGVGIALVAAGTVVLVGSWLRTIGLNPTGARPEVEMLPGLPTRPSR